MNLEVTDVTETGVIIPKTPLGAFLERYSSRKFVLTIGVLIMGSVALMQRVIDGGTYVALATLVLTSYQAGSVADKKLNGST